MTQIKLFAENMELFMFVSKNPKLRSENRMSSDHLGDIGIDNRILLKWKYYVRMWTGLKLFGIGSKDRFLST
jgi:hypothetical protein